MTKEDDPFIREIYELNKKETLTLGSLWGSPSNITVFKIKFKVFKLDPNFNPLVVEY